MEFSRYWCRGSRTTSPRHSSSFGVTHIKKHHHVMPMSSSRASNAKRNNDISVQNDPISTGTTGRPPKPKKRPKSTVATACETQRHLGTSVSNFDEAPVAATNTNTATKRRTNTNSRKKKNDNAGSTNTVQSVDSVSTVSLTLSPANSHSLESPSTGKELWKNLIHIVTII